MPRRFDIVIVGAGIHGAGIGQAAAAAGYSVLVLEQDHAAAGTSSRSSKLIHGGLRYLEQGRLSLVRECLRERENLLRIAPELVQLRDFYIPVYENSQRSPWKVRVGLALYRWLDAASRHSSYASVPRKQWDDLDGLDTRGLRRVFRYQDAQTDDAALTRAVLRSAIDLGANILMPARFIGARLAPDGCVIDYIHGGKQTWCQAGVLVNAAGPWAMQVLAAITPAQHVPAMDLVKGSHIILREPVRRGIYYVEAPRDRRAVFLIPWRNHTLVGTTEVPFRGDPATVTASLDEQGYLLETVARYFPELALHGPIDVIGRFAGLRVLPAQRRSVFARTRELIIHVDRARGPRVISVFGGKLTSYRADAGKVIHQVRSWLPARKFRANTASLPLQPDA